MMRFVLIALLALPAFGADFEAGIRHIIAKPMGEAGELEIAMSRGFAATADVFWTERISTQFAASFVNPEAVLRLQDSAEIDLGTLGLDVYSLSARFHLAPNARLSAYAGGGAALVSIGNLDDQSGDDIEAEYGSETAFLIEGGLRYRMTPRIFLDAGASYMPLTAEAETRRGNAPAELDLDPLFITVGVAFRF